MNFKCPGQDSRNIKVRTIVCKNCGQEVELFSDEMRRRCPECNGVVAQDALPSCIDWCRLAKECVGDKVYNKHLSERKIILKQKLIEGLEQYFGVDRKRIDHAKKVMDYAEVLLRLEGGDWHIVIPAGILHDVLTEKPRSASVYETTGMEKAKVEGVLHCFPTSLHSPSLTYTEPEASKGPCQGHTPGKSPSLFLSLQPDGFPSWGMIRLCTSGGRVFMERLQSEKELCS